jgi:hypothetical protein
VIPEKNLTSKITVPLKAKIYRAERKSGKI